MEAKKWWKEGVVYQIYPRSFQDSNADGIGDLNGITSRLDYIKELGADIVWISPIYESPNDDNGYDISDYRKILSDFGTMQDFDNLLKEAHQKGLKIIMDLVVNHTSDEHKWFVESRKSKDNPYRDYYIWKDNKDGNPPNNWGSYFSGSAWQLDTQTDSWYLHCFSKKQCDLNWDNPKVREEVWNLMKFWGDKGIDGFRMDVITLISKGSYANLDSKNKDDLVHVEKAVANGPKVHEYIKEMNKKVISKYDWMTVGEAAGARLCDAQKYVNADNHELNMIFQFNHVNLGCKDRGGKWNREPLDLVALKTIFNDWTIELDQKGWNSLFLGNHDQPRVVSNFGNDSPEYREVSAKMLALCLHMMKGTPYVFQGEELGMTNNKNFTELSQYNDIETINAYTDLTNLGFTKQESLAMLQKYSRDNSRTPMHWDSSANAGFSKAGVKTWIEMNPNYTEINAKAEMSDKDSVYYFYKQLIKMRHENDVIVYGDFNMIHLEDKNIFSYERKANDVCTQQKNILVVCNFFDKKIRYTIPDAYKGDNCSVYISNMEHTEGSLQPYEAFAIVKEV